MITLFQVTGAWGVPSISPFCVKLGTWLRIAGLPHEVKDADPTRSPKGKVPYVEHEGKLLGDSQLIVEHLTRAYGVRLDERLSAEERARAHATRRMLEEGTYWNLAHARWELATGWEVYRPVFLRILPPGIGALILFFIRRGMRSALEAQGTGRHTDAEVEAMGAADIDALAALLGDRPYFCGDEPSSIDATVYAFVVSILGFPADSALKRAAAGHANLVAYRARMEARYWPSQAAA